MSDITPLTQAVSALVADYGQTRDEMVEVLTGPADGGTAGDGKVEVTLPNGTKVMVDSLALIAEKIAVAEDLSVAVDRVSITMATRLIELQTLIVKRWNEGGQ